MELLILKLRLIAKIKKIPIMKSNGIKYLTKYIKKNNIKSILEIGSAIGYSAIRMALVDKSIKIVTLEKDENRYKEALKNIKLFKLDKQIEVINMDALEYATSKKFDLMFIDAAKSKNKELFIRFSANISNTIITDNINFHGLLKDKASIKSKNLRSLVNKIEDYKSFLITNKEFNTEFLNVGDGISVSRRVS